MLRIYARVLAAVLVVIAVAVALRIPSAGRGASVLYVGSAAIFAYAGLSRRNPRSLLISAQTSKPRIPAALCNRG